ncbi:MAG: hypothetical protein ACRESS_02185 [Stenotrophobium sp.]
MNRYRLIAMPTALALAGVLLFSTPALAWRRAYPHYYPHYGYSVRVGGGWHGGYWHRGWYGPRYGWWWVVGPSWYYYDAPIYPYPGYTVVQTAPSGPPPTQYWYRCEQPAGYYPYVAQCPGGWTAVPATPPPASAQQH